MSSLNKKLGYIFVFILIYSTGSTLYLINYNKLLPIFTMIVFSIVLFRIKNIKLDIKNTLTTILIIACLLLTMVVNLDYDITHYIGITMIIILSYLIANIIEYNDLTEYYINIMKFICITSLIFYILGLINPTLVNSFQTISLDGRVDYKNIYIYNYRYSPLATFQYAYLKNNSFFWEPGAYQAFLNLALILEIKKYKFTRIKNILLIIITIITTLSTTGFVSLGLILISYIDFRIDSKKNIFISMILILFIIIVIYNKDTLFKKFDKNSSSYISFSERYEGSKEDYKLWSENIITGNGYKGYTSKQKIGSANSITAPLAKYGILFVSSILILNYIFIKDISLNIFQTLVFILVFIIIYSTENFLVSPLFLCLGFSSMRNSYK